ncbi:hypothetical protein SAMN02745746_02919 [Pseudogulbenkiania subflava DSM 22618]|uniref:Uncharacterized protein n=1 Tax=Pseudogulbenkiania subflava DSM 22618 TaxID=1123014 RepID=A0A1Y6C2L4_9NEIS|nr:hypothetical protein SAMN02745746_02919 [Pseudogulbenkiania subflava DSM 22618]
MAQIICNMKIKSIPTRPIHLHPLNGCAKLLRLNHSINIDFALIFPNKNNDLIGRDINLFKTQAR